LFHDTPTTDALVIKYKPPTTCFKLLRCKKQTFCRLPGPGAQGAEKRKTTVLGKNDLANVDLANENLMNVKALAITVPEFFSDFE
jgi:hypothetical protein